MAKNIILLSDGTGNSSNAINKSNVWRLMQTLDVSLPKKNQLEQLAFYDDGVGSTGPVFVQKLMGAFGFGLSRNVRDLYEHLCRHYEPGDKIYIFGFSRGAFTARVLAHFIGICGILNREKNALNTGICDQPSDKKMNTDRGLKRGVADAYRSYRQWYWDNAANTALIAKFIRCIWYFVLRTKVLKPDKFKKELAILPTNKKPIIHFVGVWDTVDALGMPIKELSDVIDRAMYPYKFPDHVLGADVAYARQALAIDDERHSFTPLPWDECLFGSQNKLNRKARLRQVWFAGMHADIGGGYSEDTLAYIPLDWMIDEIKALEPGTNGLRFLSHLVDVIKKKAQPTGKMHDSRRGLATFYRYKPRSMPELCGHKNAALIEHYHAKQKEGTGFGEGTSMREPYIPTPIIHHSVIDRLQQTIVGYAPAGFTEHFDVFRPDGKVTAFGADQTDKETDTQRKIRNKAQDRGAAHIWWRRTAYFCMLTTLFAILGIPLVYPYDPALSDVSLGWLSWLVETGTAPLTSLLPALLAGPISYWTKAWTQFPELFLGLSVFLYGLYRWNLWIRGNIQRVAEYGWSHVRSTSNEDSQKWPEPKINFFENLAQCIRKHKIWDLLMNFMKNVVLPVVFIITVLALAYFLVARTYYHIKVTALESGACNYLTAGNPVFEKSNEDWIVIDISNPCSRTDISLDKGLEYRVNLSPAIEFGNGKTDEPPLCTVIKKNYRGDDVNYQWKDDTLDVSPAGLNLATRLFDFRFWLAAPLKRHMFSRWMVLTGEVGEDSGSYVALSNDQLRFTAPATGVLHLYVNDAVALWPITKLRNTDAAHFYENNHGKICVKVDRL